MKHVNEFIIWALAHAKSAPKGALLIAPINIEPWEYLYGTTGRVCTQALLDEKYNKYYSKWDWTRAEYDKATAGWAERKQMVCDCQGLEDCYSKSDTNAKGNFAKYCSIENRGRTSEINRPYVIGEAVFKGKTEKDINHVGFICGFMEDGRACVVEEKGLSYGCVVTILEADKNWKYRGLMDLRYAYETAPIPIPDPTEAFRAVTSGDVRLRAGRSSESAKIITMKKGTPVLALPEVDGWCDVAVYDEGRLYNGYASAKYIKEV
ncbi:SH3 domain-containing protein [Christensenellaceae bacterium OttesenSCG-928-L17]|nr:SH3 domain-containing protein [Christensenellaceae bacterium OttesenSCG-928-L17]